MERKNNDELEEILADYARLKEKELMEENTFSERQVKNNRTAAPSMKFIKETELRDQFWKKYGYRSNILAYQFECPCRHGNIDLVTVENVRNKEGQGKIKQLGNRKKNIWIFEIFFLPLHCSTKKCLTTKYTAI